MGLILIIFLAGIAFLVVLALLFFGLYNGLVRARIGSETAWADIDVQLKRRLFEVGRPVLEITKGKRLNLVDGL